MTLRILLVAGVALTLAGCSDGPDGRCKSPIDPKADRKAAAVEPGPVLNAEPGRIDARSATADAKACVQRYAWRLSKGKDDTQVVAAAAVTACDGYIAAATQAEGGQDLNAVQNANIDTMTRWATLYVVQYRADVCD